MILVRRNIRAIGSNELLFPLLAVESIELVGYVRDSQKHEYELFYLENGQRYRATDLLFLEPVDEDLLVAMRLEAQIMARIGEVPGKRRR
jgi:hypothetical protein